jgi:hypothetical protein
MAALVTQTMMGAAQTAAQFAPVPWLGAATGVLVALYNMFQKAESNKYVLSSIVRDVSYGTTKDMVSFSSKIAALVSWLSSKTRGRICPRNNRLGCVRVSNSWYSDQIVYQSTDLSISTLQGVLERMEPWCTMHKMKLFVKQDELASTIQQCHGDISDCLVKLQVIKCCSGQNITVLTLFRSRRSCRSMHGRTASSYLVHKTSMIS